MNQQVRSLIVIATSLLLLTISLAVAQRPNWEGRFSKVETRGQGLNADRDRSEEVSLPPRFVLQRILNLEDDQLEAIQALRSDFKAAAEPVRDQMKAASKALSDLLSNDSPDAAAVGEQVIALRNLRQEIRVTRADLGAAFEALLTGEQLERLEEWRNQPRRGRWGAGRPGGRQN